MAKSTFSTRKAAAYEVKHRLIHNAVNRHDVPPQLFIVTNYRPGRRPNWTVTGVTPVGSEQFYGPFRQSNVQAKTEALGVEWEPMWPDWMGRPI